MQKKRTTLKQVQRKDTTEIVITLLKKKLDLRQNIKSILLLSMFTAGAVGGRAALQHVPSVEPITPFAILAGFVLGPIYGFIAGASAFYGSNYLVWGGQGPWTIFQCLGAGVAGLIGGIFGKLWKNAKWFMLAAFVGTAFYEIIINIGMGLLWTGLFGLPWFILTSIPFSAVHIATSLGFCAVLWKFREKLPKLGGKIIEKYKIGFSRHLGHGGTSSWLSPRYFEQLRYRTSGNRSKLIGGFRWKKREPE